MIPSASGLAPRGSAPRLARILSRRRRVLDAVLDPRVMGSLPTTEELDSVIGRDLSEARDFEDALDRARIVGNEQMFLTGTAVEVTPVQSAGPWNFEVGDLTRQLAKDYDDLVHGRIPNE